MLDHDHNDTYDAVYEDQLDLFDKDYEWEYDGLQSISVLHVPDELYDELCRIVRAMYQACGISDEEAAGTIWCRVSESLILNALGAYLWRSPN